MRRKRVVSLLIASVLLCALVVAYAWNDTMLGCVPNPLPKWLPVSAQIVLEVRCHA